MEECFTFPSKAAKLELYCKDPQFPGLYILINRHHIEEMFTRRVLQPKPDVYVVFYRLVCTTPLAYQVQL